MTSSTDQAIRPATEADIDELVVLQLHLFEQDAGVYERFADLTWPTREGHADFENLISSDDGLVLVAEIDDPGNGTTATGFLVGYLTPSSPTRQSVLYGVLRSLFVEAAHRGSGAG